MPSNSDGSSDRRRYSKYGIQRIEGYRFKTETFFQFQYVIQLVLLPEGECGHVLLLHSAFRRHFSAQCNFIFGSHCRCSGPNSEMAFFFSKSKKTFPTVTAIDRYQFVQIKLNAHFFSLSSSSPLSFHIFLVREFLRRRPTKIWKNRSMYGTQQRSQRDSRFRKSNGLWWLWHRHRITHTLNET